MVGLAGCGQLLGDDSDESNMGRTEACGTYEPTVSGSSGWRTVGGDPAGTGVVPATGAPEAPLSLDWTFTLGGMAGAVRPVATADRVYAHEMDSMLYAVDAGTGEEVWGKRVDAPRGSSAIGDDVVVTLAESTVLGLNPETGKTRWTGPDSHVGLFQGSPVIIDETVYVPTELSLLALNLADGSIRWQHTTGEETVATPAIIGDTIYYGDYDTYVYALDAATGEERWRVKTNAHIDCNVAIADGTVFAGSDEGVLHALDAGTGDHRWTYDLQSIPKVIASDGAHAYVGAGATLHALEVVTGAHCWSTENEDSYVTGIAISDGRVYAPLERIGSENGGLPGVLDAATGEALAETHGQFESSWARFNRGPAVVDGAVYASGVDEGGITLARFS
ncbi:PQQ-binding-like beta-propeller repeat protein [Halorarum halophilum]|uniref:PQQ-binding-like beta-propeller repeat protein n=1 Tax=Halorarum halophilum TaxID=2743090 RepID=A0A7D5GZD3_9EURY|nr:PQQ-like beta-propeller repeat protein [Halobaculum halophilum]QLG27413.1 PQQ-binding-like beta-propeller repeat protein [Halobaculum halophilum]